MDTKELSLYAAAGTLLVRVGAVYLQSKFPDSRKIRHIHIPSMALAALSYAAQGHDKGVALYAGATARSSMRITKFGAKHRNLIGAFMTAAVGAYTAATYQTPSDLIPVTSFAVGTAGDMSPQGRYMRLMFMVAMGAGGFSYAIIKDNPMMVAVEVVSTAFMTKAIYQHDIKDAAGHKKGLAQNMKAYLHGIFRRSATGAKAETQVNTDHLNPKKPNDMTVIQARYEESLQLRPNPYFKPPLRAIG